MINFVWGIDKIFGPNIWGGQGILPDALQGRVDFEGLADLVDALGSVGAYSFWSAPTEHFIGATELIETQTAIGKVRIGSGC